MSFAALNIFLAGCFGVSEDPCADYCDALCACSDQDVCDECHAVYDEADGELQDECEAELQAVEECDTAE